MAGPFLCHICSKMLYHGHLSFSWHGLNYAACGQEHYNKVRELLGETAHPFSGFVTTHVDSMRNTPKMWGSNEAIECQMLLLLDAEYFILFPDSYRNSHVNRCIERARQKLQLFPSNVPLFDLYQEPVFINHMCTVFNLARELLRNPTNEEQEEPPMKSKDVNNKPKKGTPKKLTPPDLERCQVEKPNGHSFMTLGGRPGLERCIETPTFILSDTEPQEDGQMGSMSVCNSCFDQFRTQCPGSSVKAERITATFPPGWRRFKETTCDLCDRPAVFNHTQGGLRCERCPRPEQ